MEWQPDGPNALVRWMQRRAYRKYGPPKMSWIEAEMLRERMEVENPYTAKDWIVLFIGIVAIMAAVTTVVFWLIPR